MTPILIDQCLAQLSSEKLPPVASGNKHRDPHQTLCIVRDLETHSSKWDVFITSLPLKLREPCGRDRKYVKVRRDAGHQDNKFL